MSLVPESSSFSVEIGCTWELIARLATVRSLLLSSTSCSFIIISTQSSWCTSTPRLCTQTHSAHPASSSPSSFDCLSTTWLFVLTRLRLSMACTTMSTQSWRLLGCLNSALPAAKFQAIPHPAFCPSTTLVCMEFLHERFDAFQGAHHPPVVRAAGDRYSGHFHDDFRQSRASSLFQLSQSWGSVLESFHSSSGQLWCFRQLHLAASLSGQST